MRKKLDTEKCGVFRINLEKMKDFNSLKTKWNRIFSVPRK